MDVQRVDPFAVQKRLRNVTGLAVRHLDSRLLPTSGFGLGFTLSHSDSREPYFVSDIVRTTVNPTWEEIDHDFPDDSSHLSLTRCTVQLFLCSQADDAVRRLLSWELDLRVLICIGETLDSVERDFPLNSVIFLLRSGVYVFPENIPPDFPAPPLIHQRAPRKWCSPSQVRQLLKLEKDFLHVRQRRRFNFMAVADLSRANTRHQNVERSIAEARHRTDTFRIALRDCRHSISLLHLSITDTTMLNHSLSSTLESNQIDLSERRQQLTESRSEVVKQKEDFKELYARLRDRRCEVVSALRSVYPIHRSPSGRVFIVNIWLPSMDQFTTCDDTTLSVSLGCVTHLLLLLSRILNVPLRYPMKFLGSASSVTDQTAARLFEREREYPLHTRSRDRNRFIEAVMLLNANVIQLRLTFGLGTQEVRKTLDNIQSLMQERFQARPPRTPSFPLPQSPAPGDAPPNSFSPAFATNGDGHVNGRIGRDEPDAAIAPPTPAVIFPVQSASDFGHPLRKHLELPDRKVRDVT